MKKFLLQYKHGIIAIIYMIFYLTWFSYLEKNVTNSYYLIHMKMDNYIPFLEIFVIPYFMWFGYVAAVIIYLIFTDKRAYYKCCIFLFTGMTVFLAISTLWPNGHNLRPYILPNENFLAQMVRSLYQFDTPTNLWPSIHVYNSLGAHLGVLHSSGLRHRKWIRHSSFILCSSIVLSTVFIKQHSLFDVITAFILAVVMYMVTYPEEHILIGRTGRLSKQEQWLS